MPGTRSPAAEGRLEVTLDELRALAKPDGNGNHIFQGAYRQMSVTLEEADLLYAIVRATQPSRVLELGTGLGLSARFIAEALVANQHGRLVTVEPKAMFWPSAGDLLADLPASIHAEALVDPTEVDLVFVDSGYEYRAADIREWLSNGYGGPVLVHDAERRYPELERGCGVFLASTSGLWIGRGA